MILTGLPPYLIFVFSSPQAQFLVNFFSTQKRVNRGKTDLATNQRKLLKHIIGNKKCYFQQTNVITIMWRNLSCGNNFSTWQISPHTEMVEIWQPYHVLWTHCGQFLKQLVEIKVEIKIKAKPSRLANQGGNFEMRPKSWFSHLLQHEITAIMTKMVEICQPYHVNTLSRSTSDQEGNFEMRSQSRFSHLLQHEITAIMAEMVEICQNHIVCSECIVVSFLAVQPTAQ